MLMAQRLRMLAVQSKTSNEIQNSHRILPKGHKPNKQSPDVRFHNEKKCGTTSESSNITYRPMKPKQLAA